MSARRISLADLQGALTDWGGPGALELRGQLNDGSEEMSIGTSRDAQGSVLRLSIPEFHGRLFKKQASSAADTQPKGESRLDRGTERQWAQWWAKVAVRAGYLLPLVDPVAFSDVVRLSQDPRSRIELILDTNALISGVGHWLARVFGARADFVRTSVTDLEIHEFGDRLKWEAEKFETLSARASFLAASRFLEHSGSPTTLWRRLDTEEETALFVARSSEGGGKSPGRDTLLLHASRRAVLDRVPRLTRFFVTGDQGVARAALHELPEGSVIAAYVNPLPKEVYLTPDLWLPSGYDQGRVVRANLATFVREALCLCTVMRLERDDGAKWCIRAHVVGGNQFPSDWTAPLLFVEEEPAANGQACGGGKSPPDVPEPAATAAEAPPTAIADAAPGDAIDGARSPEANVSAAVVAAEHASVEPGQTATSATPAVAKNVPKWPFRKKTDELLKPGTPGAPDVPPLELLERLRQVAAAVQTRGAVDFVTDRSERKVRNVIWFLRLGNFIDNGGRPLSNAKTLPEIFESNDLDALSQLCTRVESYHRLIEQLRTNKSMSIEQVRELLRSATALAGLARTLGQAVLAGDVLHYGGAYVGRAAFLEWLRTTTDAVAGSSRLAEAQVATLAVSAMNELDLSPARFERALRVALFEPDFEPATGGTVDRLLMEKIAELHPDQVRVREVSADGLCGIRSLKRRS